MKTPPWIADFDSTAGMLRALARFLRGEDYPALGSAKGVGAPLASLVNVLPRGPRERVYALGGWIEAFSAERLAEVRAEAISDWVVGHYGRPRVPAVAVGSSNGAAVHLWSAMRIPWLPQTFLLPVRRSGIDPDDPRADMAWGERPGRVLLEANPELQLHHMHDPNQDRLMIRYMTYFRVKRRTLGAAYERFLEETLEPGGTIILQECTRRWPVVCVGERHWFQPGAMGGLEPDEYVHGSPRVADYLCRYGIPLARWDYPTPDDEQPESEWGFGEALRDDVLRFARAKGYRVLRLVFTEPEDLSPGVAELHRRWYRDLGWSASRLLVESFIVMEPWWALRTGSVPWWAKFPVEPDAAALERWLEGQPGFEEIRVMLFSHGVESAGLAGIERWRRIIGRAKSGGFLGVDTEAFPRDFATFVRYNPALRQEVAERHALPPPMSLARLDELAGPGVRILDATPVLEPA